MASVLLVGGVGFIGVNVARVAVGEGWGVCIASRRSSLERRPLHAGVLKGLGVPVYAAGGLLEAVGEAVEACRPSCLVYLVGVMGGGRAAWEAHVGLWRRVLEAYGGRVDHTVYYSAATVTPCRRSIRGVGETHPALVGARDAYTLSKREGELIALRASREGAASVSILRPVLVYGPYATHPEHRLFARLARHGLRLGLPVDAVPAADVARITLWLCERRPGGRWFYAARPETHTLRELFDALCEGRRCADLSPLARLAARLASITGRPARLAVLARWLECGWRIRPWGLLEAGYDRWVALGEAIREYKEWLSRL